MNLQKMSKEYCEMFFLLAYCYTNKEICEIRCISPKTCTGEIHILYNKLNFIFDKFIHNSNNNRKSSIVFLYHKQMTDKEREIVENKLDTEFIQKYKR